MKDFSIFVLISIVFGCAKIPQIPEEVGVSEQIAKIAIDDIVNNSGIDIYENDSVFFISAFKNRTESIELTIYPPLDKYTVIKGQENLIDFPTSYYEIDGRIFFWDDLSNDSMSDVKSKLKEYNQIDTLGAGDTNIERIDDSNEGILYYFCVDDPTKFKLVQLGSTKYSLKLKCN